MTVLVSDAQVRRYVTMEHCLVSVEAAFAAAGRGDFVVSERKVVELEEAARLLSLSAGSAAIGRLVANVYSGAPSGHSKTGSPVNKRQKFYLLFSAATGECEAIIAGATLSRLKTGAMGAVAIRHLASAGARRLSILGSGRQARAALSGALAVRSFTDIRVWSPTMAHADQFARDFGGVVRVEATPEQAVRGADVVVTATTSPSPILLGDWLEPGAHVNSIGAHYPSQRELDGRAVEVARIFVDTEVAARAEKGELLLAEKEGLFDFASDLVAELGEVVAGVAQWEREEHDITLFASCGSAIESLGAAVGALGAIPVSERVSFEF